MPNNRLLPSSVATPTVDHLSPSPPIPPSSTVTPTLCMSHFTTSVYFLWDLPLFLLNRLSSTVYPPSLLCTDPNHLWLWAVPLMDSLWTSEHLQLCVTATVSKSNTITSVTQIKTVKRFLLTAFIWNYMRLNHLKIRSLTVEFYSCSKTNVAFTIKSSHQSEVSFSFLLICSLWHRVYSISCLVLELKHVESARYLTLEVTAAATPSSPWPHSLHLPFTCIHLAFVHSKLQMRSNQSDSSWQRSLWK